MNGSEVVVLEEALGVIEGKFVNLIFGIFHPLFN